MKKKIFCGISAVLIFNILFVSCSEEITAKTSVTVDKFPVNAELTSDYITVNPVITSPSELFISGNYFVVKNEQTDTIFTVFSYPEFEYKFSDGIYGRGPNDFKSMERYYHLSAKGFNVFFPGINIYREVEIDGVNRQLKTVREHKYRFPVTGIPQKFTQLDDTRFIYVNGVTNDTEFCLFDATPIKDIVAGVVPYPKWVEATNGEPNFSIYLSGIVAKPDGKKFASFYSNFKRWRLFEGNGSLIREIEVNTPPLFAGLAAPGENRTIYYYHPFASDTYIYAFCLNYKLGEPQTGGTELQVWNWEGKPVAKFILDRKLSCFTVSGDSVLYGANNLAGSEDKIFKYILPLSKK